METKQLAMSVLLLTLCCYLAMAQRYEKPPQYRFEIGDNEGMKELVTDFKPYVRVMATIGLALMQMLGFQDVVAQAYPLYRANPHYKIFFDEIDAVAEAASDNETTITSQDVFTFGIFYDMDARCTSLLARSPHHPAVLHVHNFDFPYASLARMAMYDGNYYSHGRLIYTCNNIAGFVGYFMCLKPNKFSITLNERWMEPHPDRFTANLLAGKIPVSWLIRLVLLHAESYEEAVRMFIETPTISGAFLGIAGNGPHEGIEITKSPNETLHIVTLDKKNKFIVQCNSDWNNLTSDATRRTQNATLWMSQLFEQDNVTLDSMKEQVLMKYPVQRNESDEGGSGTISVVTLGANSHELKSLIYFPPDSR